MIVWVNLQNVKRSYGVGKKTGGLVLIEVDNDNGWISSRWSKSLKVVAEKVKVRK